MEKLQEIRKKAGMSRETLAQMLNVSTRTIVSYESGERRPMPETAKEIAQIFNLTIEEMWEMFYSSDKSDNVDAFENKQGYLRPALQGTRSVRHHPRTGQGQELY